MIGYLRRSIVLLLTLILSFKAGAQNQIITNGAATFPVNFTGAGCRYNWTNSNPAIGLAASGMGNIASFTAVNTGTAPITATITATPVAAGYAYIPNAADGTVSAIDLSTKTLKAKISVGETPVSEAISEDGSKVYIVNSGSYSLSVINTATNTVTATIPLVNFNTGAGYVLTDLTYGPIAGHPEGVAVSPDGKHVYVANRGIAYSIDTKDNNNNVTGHVNVYVIYVIDTTTGDVSMISFGKDASSVRVSRDGTLLYVSDFSSTISVIDLIHTQSARPILISGITAGNDNATLQGAGVATIKATIVEPPTTFFSGTPSPYIMVLTPDGSEMYVTNTNGFTVSAINTATNTIISTINVGQFPGGICMSADGSKIYVACSGSNLVDVISTATNTIVKTYFSLNAPTAVSLSPDGKLLYVNNAQTSDIAIIDVSSSANSAIDDINLGGTAYSNGGQVGNFITPGSCSGSPVTFTITVNPINTANALLASITTTPQATLTSTTGPGFLNYKTSVANIVGSIQIAPTAQDAAAAISVNGQAVASGTLSQVIPLNVGANLIDILVTAQDGITTNTYTLTVTRLSTNAGLSSIKLTPNTPLTTVTGPANANYKTLVPNTQTNLTVTLTASEAHATIKVNGTTVASGVASQPIPLSVGDNIINIIVTALDGTTTKSYIITATRAGSAVATLSNLALSAGALNPVFATATTGYTAIVANSTSSIKITPTVTDAAATIKVNGATVASGMASASLPLIAGTNTITTIVTAQDGSTAKTYTVTVTRAAANLSTNAGLSAIKLTPNTALTTVTGPGNGNYTTAIPNTQTSLTVTLTASEAHATIKVNGTTVTSGIASQSIPLSIGANVINILVTAQDGATVKSYIITATRAGSAVATLANLALSTGTLSPLFATTTTSYTAIVANSISSIKITPTATDANATIKVNGAIVTSGAASASLPLIAGTNTVTTVVTAQDGTTVKTYTVTVTRAAAGLSTNAGLSGIKLTPNTALTTVTGPGNGNYTTPVPYSESSLTVTTTTSEAHATIKVNGTAVTSGLASQSILLNVGDNVINIVVTAQDGATAKSYIITAKRAAGSLVALYDAPADSLKTGGVIVHQGVSPNGDGDNDVLTIEGIAAYPDNSLTIMNRSGALIFKAKGYNNTSVVFDGHSSRNGRLQQAGTYFYSLEYKDGDKTKRKTGFILLKY